MTKVQLTLTDQEAAILSGYGEQFGYNLPKMAKFLISKATENIFQKGVAVYQMSEATEKRGLEALEDFRAGKTVEVKDAEAYFSKL